MTKKLRVPLLAIGLLAVLVMASAIQANDKTNLNQPMSPAAQNAPMARHPSAYLGIGVEALNPALASQLPGLLKDGQGVLVSEVASGSPAEKAGLKAFDIVTQYDNQKVLSPEQFVKLVRHDQAGREAKLTVIRGGAAKTIQVTLGKHSRPAEFRQPQAIPWPSNRFGFRPISPLEAESQWTSFDSMTLARVGKDRYKAEISYKNEKGQIETRKYEGTLDQIRTDVEKTKDLPRNEQAHLLRAINSPDYLFGFPFIGMIPNPGVMWNLE